MMNKNESGRLNQEQLRALDQRADVNKSQQFMKGTFNVAPSHEYSYDKSLQNSNQKAQFRENFIRKSVGNAQIMSPGVTELRSSQDFIVKRKMKHQESQGPYSLNNSASKSIGKNNQLMRKNFERFKSNERDASSGKKVEQNSNYEYSNKQQVMDNYYPMSPTTKSRVSETNSHNHTLVSRSTSFSRPFTSLSYVSSTTLGTSLSQKIEKLNKQGIKQLAKQLIQCQHQLEQVLQRNKLTLKSMLTIQEIGYYLQNGGTDLQLSLDQLQSMLIAVMLIQPKQDAMLNFKSILKASQNYIDQSDFENRDFFNKSKIDRMMDQIKDSIYVSKIDLKKHFVKLTESDNDNYDKTVMTLDQFNKFIRITIGDKLSGREQEQLYKSLANKKPLQFKRFMKLFTQFDLQLLIVMWE